MGHASREEVTSAADGGDARPTASQIKPDWPVPGALAKEKRSLDDCVEKTKNFNELDWRRECPSN